MGAEDAPAGSNPSPAPLYIQRNPPPALDPKTGKPATRYVSYRERIGNLGEQIIELEERLGETTRDTRIRLENVENQLTKDRCEMADLKWKMAAWEEDRQDTPVEWREAKGGKRGKGRTRHLYGTHYAQRDETALTTKEGDDIARRVRKAEERLDRQRRETQELREELAKFQVLASKISELSKAFQRFRTNQERTNVVVTQEITALRTRLDSDVSQHGSELADLRACYSTLHALATGLFTNAQQTAMSRCAVNPQVQPLQYPAIVANIPAAGAPYYRSTPPIPTNPNVRQLPPLRKTITA